MEGDHQKQRALEGVVVISAVEQVDLVCQEHRHYNRGNVSKVIFQNYMAKPTNWSATSQRIYIQKQQNTLQVMWPLNANTEAISDGSLKQDDTIPTRNG